jgi:hypothetical protein
MRARWVIATGGLIAVLATSALAVDGVIEINQAAVFAGGITPGDMAGFPVTLSRAGSYRLTGNLDVTIMQNGNPQADSQNITAIAVTADDVHIDLNGFGIIGPVTCSGSPLACSPAGTGRGVSADNAINGTVVRSGFVRGMGDDGVVLGNTCLVENVVARDNAQDALSGGLDCIFRSNIVRGNGGLGLSGQGIFLNNVANSSSIGIFTEGASVVHGNYAVFNRSHGIQATAGGTVVGNEASQNAGVGLNLGSNGTGYADNRAANNGMGNVSGGVQTGGNVCGAALCP